MSTTRIINYCNERESKYDNKADYNCKITTLGTIEEPTSKKLFAKLNNDLFVIAEPYRLRLFNTYNPTQIENIFELKNDSYECEDVIPISDQKFITWHRYVKESSTAAWKTITWQTNPLKKLEEQTGELTTRTFATLSHPIQYHKKYHGLITMGRTRSDYLFWFLDLETGTQYFKNFKVNPEILPIFRFTTLVLGQNEKNAVYSLASGNILLRNFLLWNVSNSEQKKFLSGMLLYKVTKIDNKIEFIYKGKMLPDEDIIHFAQSPDQNFWAFTTSANELKVFKVYQGKVVNLLKTYYNVIVDKNSPIFLNNNFITYQCANNFIHVSHPFYNNEYQLPLSSNINFFNLPDNRIITYTSNLSIKDEISLPDKHYLPSKALFFKVFSLFNNNLPKDLTDIIVDYAHEDYVAENTTFKPPARLSEDLQIEMQFVYDSLITKDQLEDKRAIHYLADLISANPNVSIEDCKKKMLETFPDAIKGYFDNPFKKFLRKLQGYDSCLGGPILNNRLK